MAQETVSKKQHKSNNNNKANKINNNNTEILSISCSRSMIPLMESNYNDYPLTKKLLFSNSDLSYLLLDVTKQAIYMVFHDTRYGFTGRYSFVKNHLLIKINEICARKDEKYEFRTANAQKLYKLLAAHGTNIGNILDLYSERNIFLHGFIYSLAIRDIIKKITQKTDVSDAQIILYCDLIESTQKLLKEICDIIENK